MLGTCGLPVCSGHSQTSLISPSEPQDINSNNKCFLFIKALLNIHIIYDMTDSICHIPKCCFMLFCSPMDKNGQETPLLEQDCLIGLSLQSAF